MVQITNACVAQKIYTRYKTVKDYFTLCSQFLSLVKVKQLNKMVTVAATHTYLRTVTGLGNDPQGLEWANAVMAEGLNNLADIFELAEDDGIKTLCTSVQKPAGTMTQPGWVAPNSNPNNVVAPQVPRTGHVIPTICEQRLTSAAYGVSMYEAIGRTIDPTSLSRAR